GEAYSVGGVAGFDLGDDLAIAGQGDLVPELAHHVGGRPERNRRADLGGEAVVAGGELHVDDVAVLELAMGWARIAEHHRRISHWCRSDDEKIDIAAALENGGGRRRGPRAFRQP